jgi:hypothetical protein
MNTSENAAQTPQRDDFSTPVIDLVVGPVVILLKVLVGRGPAIRAEQLAQLLRIDLSSLYHAQLASHMVGDEGWRPLARVWTWADDGLRELAEDAGAWVVRCRDLAALLKCVGEDWPRRMCADDLLAIRSVILPELQESEPLSSLLNVAGAHSSVMARFTNRLGFEFAVSADGMADVETGIGNFFKQHHGKVAAAVDFFMEGIKKGKDVPEGEDADKARRRPHATQARELGREDHDAGRPRRSTEEIFEAVGLVASELPAPGRALAEVELRAAYDAAYDLPARN